MDTIVDRIMKEFDTTTSVIKNDGQRISLYMRNKLLNSLKMRLDQFIDTVSLKIYDEIIESFQNDISNFTISQDLDEKLENAIRKSDELFCNKRFKLIPKILKDDKLFNAKLQSQRRNLIQNLKDVSNHILEYAISKGLFYHKFSLTDGISYIPRNFVTRIFHKILSKLALPLHISLNYLSPSAFGLSNIFNSYVGNYILSPLHSTRLCQEYGIISAFSLIIYFRSKKPQMCRYFTNGIKTKNILSRLLSNDKVPLDDYVYTPD